LGDWGDVPLIKCEEGEYPDDMSNEEICDNMWMNFNMDNRPDGKIRRSMSVGDVIEINGIKYQALMIGWKELVEYV
jgi:hypothetical protein